ncbi:putative endoglucanase E1 [Tricladium varicosporioides]|nr:putative endoglucanase E1 [Hymenoscyphus varicosporioides]
MRLSTLLPLALTTSALASAIPNVESSSKKRASWPYGPFVSSGRYIHNSLGENVTYVGVNWPGAADAMIPEGLQYQPISKIVSDIKSLGMNVIRLTYAVEMVDDIFDNGGDKTLLASFQNALGTANGLTVVNKIIANNPSFTQSTTRVQVFDAVAAECKKQGIYVHLDNHISKGEWCCSLTDGNGWFGDTYFNVTKWKRGWEFMAKRGASWGNLMSVGLRNEPRDTSNNAAVSATYNWETWYTHMTSAASTVHTANPDVLIFFSGLNYDTTLAPITLGSDLGSGSKFIASSFPYANKIVLELHNYQTTATSCSSITSGLYNGGYNAMDTTNTAVKNILPVVMTEWGHDETNSEYSGVYATCLKSYLGGLKGGWMVWALGGSYYIREGTQDSDETWGLYNHNWTAWRSDPAIAAIKSMVTATL